MVAADGGWRRQISLCALFVRQELRTRFDGSLLGAAWAVVAPLLQLLVFYVVFLHVFKARVPGLAPDAYLAFLALGFWPWFAFSESVMRASTAIHESAALAAKVALPLRLVVLARVCASFLLHGGGYVVVLLALLAFGPVLQWHALPIAAALWGALFVMAAGVALLVASLQVFVRDLGQSIGPLLSLWFFLTPIVYALGMTPGALRAVLVWNPLTAVVEGQRAALLFPEGAVAGWPGLLLGVVLLPLAGLWVFHRLEPWFEDYR